ncbi:hypothetical protein [Solitalea canadensis]|uniref:Uncharacterized protein n=1 Tax=Solitalea canadensis (strain ATCC 29591 / DSM 3403 / JCM 21819 / LMG 8368 / NBRC 15130 / NCIMB 12057 / USAM 9D) TaxID=929556 RepID=H8KXD3_SOLCM|nr:hypothetical protein [Solitalea canadensis]AFD08462.1 hypothetical protein Solca_3457 [Solitalea canadensis DSM 3403]
MKRKDKYKAIFLFILINLLFWGTMSWIQAKHKPKSDKTTSSTVKTL